MGVNMAKTDAKTSRHHVAVLHSSALWEKKKKKKKKRMREKEEEKGRFLCIGIRENDGFLNAHWYKSIHNIEGKILAI